MFWAAKRQTTRVEDAAYYLMGFVRHYHASAVQREALMTTGRNYEAFWRRVSVCMDDPSDRSHKS